MSINVDKMDSKNVEPSRKSKSTLKRRKKTTSLSDLSSGSLSPSKRQFYSNNFPEENQSSPDASPYSSSPGPFNDIFRYSHNLPQQNNGYATSSTSSASKNDFTDSINGYQQNGSLKRPIVSNQNGNESDSNASVNMTKRQPRTTEDFYLFCQFILEYENYDEALRNSTHSPLDSTGSATESTTSSAANEESNHAIGSIDTKDDEKPKELDVSNSLDDSKSSVNNKISAIDVSSTNEDVTDDSDIDADSYNLITCYCGKPYARRPMIECSKCLTWLHLSCAKVKRKHIPDIFICVKCAKSNDGSKATAPTTPAQPQQQSTHPKDLQGSEPKENSRSKRSTTASRTDKLENNILQPLNVSASYETGANNLDNIKTSSATSIAVKYK